MNKEDYNYLKQTLDYFLKLKQDLFEFLARNNMVNWIKKNEKNIKTFELELMKLVDESIKLIDLDFNQFKKGEKSFLKEIAEKDERTKFSNLFK